jgi:hypothetical protein
MADMWSMRQTVEILESAGVAASYGSTGGGIGSVFVPCEGGDMVQVFPWESDFHDYGDERVEGPLVAFRYCGDDAGMWVDGAGVPFGDGQPLHSYEDVVSAVRALRDMPVNWSVSE